MLLWLFLVTVTLLRSPVSCTSVVHSQHGAKQGILCKEIERKALLTFKSGLDGSGELLSSWSGDNPNCCHWKGVICSNQTGHVLKLNLKNEEDGSFSLRGNISSSLLELKFLQYLDLSGNDFYPSVIPTFLGSMEALIYLNLSSAAFYPSVVPPHLGNMSSLQYLDLSDNAYLEVESLEWVRGLSSLKVLNLDKVNLMKAGPNWLKSLNMLPSLLELHLSSCQLSNLPPLINHSINFTSLATLDLSHNSFNSSISLPLWLFNLSGLVNLQLSSCSLQGVAIPNEIGRLGKLQQLELSGNNMGGQLPASLGNLTNLMTLNLASNGIDGTLVRSLRFLCKLWTLNLQNNNLKGGINELLDGFSRCSIDNNNTNLESLSLGSNKLFGSLPSSLGSLVKLVNLDLSYNSFWGSIPKTIGSLTSLTTLDLSHNKINGTIVEAIGELSELVNLDLSDNDWQGFLTEIHFEKHTKLKSLAVSTTSKGNLVMDVRQDWIPPFRNLTTVTLDGTKMLSKKFPVWIQTQHELDFLSLVDCGISDAIPTEFWKSCINVNCLTLSNNAISIGSSFKNLEGLLPLVPDRLEELYLDGNYLGSINGGEIPSRIGQLAPSLLVLDMSSNSLSGSIPQSICDLGNLIYLVLRNNSLIGELTHYPWVRLEAMNIFDISNNSFFGKIPESIGWSALTMLLLNDNHFQGELPTLDSCMGLQILDVGGNNLTGKIPASLSEYKLEFIILRLRGNMLSGTIPPELCLLSSLKTLDLAHNSFHGMIPWCLGNLSSVDKGYNNFSSISDGIELVFKGRAYNIGPRTLPLVHLLDLSDNNLSGNIPESLMDLTALQTLNLSMNNLTGGIPSKIGELRMLESLDLSQNQLSGPIPQSFSDFSSLNYLNLSHNNLSGKIPSSRQLQTLEESSSYDGNPLLCGLPLPTECPGDGTEKDNHGGGGHGAEKVDHGKKKIDLDKWGFILSLVSGFFVGFWGVCGSLVLKASWRHSYFRFLEDLRDKIVVIVVVNVARLQKKMEEGRMTN